MKKLILAVGLLVAAAAPLSSDAQVSVSVTIGRQPAYWPVGYYSYEPRPYVLVRRAPMVRYREPRWRPAAVRYRSYPRYERLVYVNSYRMPPGHAKKALGHKQARWGKHGRR